MIEEQAKAAEAEKAELEAAKAKEAEAAKKAAEEKDKSDESKEKAAEVKSDKEEIKVEAKPVADQTTELVTAAGIDPATMAKELAETGEVSPHTLKALVEEHGEAVAKLLVDSARGIQKEAKEKVEQANKDIFATVEEAFALEEGQGKEGFSELAKWTRENASEEELAGFNAMLNAGGFQAKLAIQTLANAYQGNPQYTQDADLTSGDGTGGETGKPITASDYATELDKLLESGEPYESRKVQDLKRRRAASRARGY